MFTIFTFAFWKASILSCNGKVGHEKNNKTIECFSERKCENVKNVKIRGNCTPSLTYFSKRKCENGKIYDDDIKENTRQYGSFPKRKRKNSKHAKV
jgi:hypothetical protein